MDMQFEENQIYHLYNQGNNRQRIFQSEIDYETFLNYVRKFLLSYTDLICYCLMPNHFHFLVHTNESSSVLIKQGGLIIDSLTNGVRKLLSGYTRVFNRRYERSGSLFRQKTKAKWITGLVRKEKGVYTPEEYCSNCFQYIHANPVAAGLVKNPSDWNWSSYNFYAGNKNDDLCNKDLAMRYCGYDEDGFNANISLEANWRNIIEQELFS